MKRKMRWLVLSVSLLFFAATSLHQIRHQQRSVKTGWKFWWHGELHGLSPEADLGDQDYDDGPNGYRNLSETVTTLYLDEILSRRKTSLSRLSCPATTGERYDSLRIVQPGISPPFRSIQYFFALDLKQCLPLLPTLIGNILLAVQYLGPSRCALSIVEGNSDDGTGDIVRALGPEMERMGLAYRYRASSIDPGQADRIGRLAMLRNLALEPLITGEVHAYDDATVIFLNDVAICPDDILELVLQRQMLGADMTCAMDWTYVGRDPTFYDVWIARGMNGDSFFEIPPDGNWNSAWNLFWNAPETRSRFQSLRPFQVFSCWNGATALTAGPFLPHSTRKVRFRSPNIARGECEQGEPQLLCKDLWHRGSGKIAVVPTVNLEYSIEKSISIKKEKGFTLENVAGEYDERDTIDWRAEPPRQVKCMPTYENQYWQRWDEGLM